MSMFTYKSEGIMKTFNRVQILGRLGKDIELKEFDKFKVVNFSLATTFKVKEENISQWTDCKAFNYLAERLENAKKGDMILVIGNMKEEQWESDGNPHKKSVMECSDVELISKTEKPYIAKSAGHDAYDKMMDEDYNIPF